MSSTTFYIEHLIIGALALLIVGLGLPAPVAEQALQGETAWKVVTLAPLAYVAGLMLDGMSFPLERLAQRLLAERSSVRLREVYHDLLARRGEVLREDATSRTVDIFAWSEPVGAELRARRSRDRIARGIVANLVLLMAVWLLSRGAPQGRLHDLLEGVGVSGWAGFVGPWLALTLWSALSWFTLHRRTRSFKAAAYERAMAHEIQRAGLAEAAAGEPRPPDRGG